MRLIRYTGTAPTSVLELGDGGTIRNAEKLYTGLNVIRQTISDWSSQADIGITVRNVDASQIELRRVEGFTIGMRTLGDGRGVEDSPLRWAHRQQPHWPRRLVRHCHGLEHVDPLLWRALRPCHWRSRRAGSLWRALRQRGGRLFQP